MSDKSSAGLYLDPSYTMGIPRLYLSYTGQYTSPYIFRILGKPIPHNFVKRGPIKEKTALPRGRTVFYDELILMAIWPFDGWSEYDQGL